jgi:high-affinity iron transporter
MLPTFIIGLREGIEAALIVSIIATFLRQEGARDALRWVWAGVGAAVALCLAAGIALQLLDQELPQREQEMLETIIGAVAVGIVTFMVVWMRRHAAGLAGDVRANARTALKQGSVGALVGMAFFAVIREGLETAVFLLAAFQSASDPAAAGAGAILGVLAAVTIGVLIYHGGLRFNLNRFFRITGLVLALVAAGLVANTLHTGHEAGWVNFGQGQVLDLTWLVVPGTWTASLLTGMLGLQPQPTTIELVGYLAYAVPVIAYVLLPKLPRRRRRLAANPAAAGLSVLLIGAALLVAACGSGGDGEGSASSGGRSVAVKLTDAGCAPAELELPAGRTTFEITNAGTDKVSEFEILDGERVVEEKEHLVSGLSGSFTVDLKPGTYEMECPGGTSAETGTITVADKAGTADAGT